MAQLGLDQADVAGLGRVTAELQHRRAKGAPGQSDPADPVPAEPKPKRRRVGTAIEGEAEHTAAEAERKRLAEEAAEAEREAAEAERTRLAEEAAEAERKAAEAERRQLKPSGRQLKPSGR